MSKPLIPIADIMTAVSIVTNVPLRAILSSCQLRPTVAARFAIVRMCIIDGRQITAVGRAINRDRTTAYNANVVSAEHVAAGSPRGQQIERIMQEARAVLAGHEPLSLVEPEPPKIKPPVKIVHRAGYVNHAGEIIVEAGL